MLRTVLGGVKEDFPRSFPFFLLVLPSALKNTWRGQSKLLGKPFSFPNRPQLCSGLNLGPLGQTFWGNSAIFPSGKVS